MQRGLNIFERPLNFRFWHLTDMGNLPDVRFAPTAVARELIRFSVFPYQSRTGELLYESLSLGRRTAPQVRLERSKGRSLTVARRSFFAAAPALDALIGIPLLHATYDSYHRGGHGIGNLSSLR